MSEATAKGRRSRTQIVALKDGGSVGVLPDAHGVSNERLYEVADELRETYQVEADIEWRRNGWSSVLFFTPWPDVRSNGDL